MAFNSAPVFFKARHDSPPNPLPRLNILASQLRRPLLFQEEHSSAYVSQSNNPPLSPINNLPVSRPKKSTSNQIAKQIGSSKDRELSSSESDITSIHSDNTRIPKPSGEAGRPGRGGYTLENVMRIDEKHFKRIKKYVHRLVKAHLDEKLCKSKQSRSAIYKVVDQAVLEFPELDEYDKWWPVMDMIQMRLKYTSSRFRAKELRHKR